MKESTPAEILIRLLSEQRRTLVTAESCTGGLLAGDLTACPGASEVFPGGLVTYSNELKHRLLGVPEEIFARHGAVSGECAEAMARGVLSEFGSDYAAAITGIAGPGGGSAAKPVGLVHFAVAAADGRLLRDHRIFPGDRAAIRAAAVRRAEELLLQLFGGD